MITIRYFPCRGRVEPLRLLFVEANVAWTENPLTDFKQWPEEKKQTPFGSVSFVNHLTEVSFSPNYSFQL